MPPNFLQNTIFGILFVDTLHQIPNEIAHDSRHGLVVPELTCHVACVSAPVFIADRDCQEPLARLVRPNSTSICVWVFGSRTPICQRR